MAIFPGDTGEPEVLGLTPVGNQQVSREQVEAAMVRMMESVDGIRPSPNQDHPGYSFYWFKPAGGRKKRLLIVAERPSQTVKPPVDLQAWKAAEWVARETTEGYDPNRNRDRRGTGYAKRTVRHPFFPADGWRVIHKSEPMGG